jgi:hypothetical protein
MSSLTLLIILLATIAKALAVPAQMNRINFINARIEAVHSYRGDLREISMAGVSVGGEGEFLLNGEPGPLYLWNDQPILFYRDAVVGMIELIAFEISEITLARNTLSLLVIWQALVEGREERDLNEWLWYWLRWWQGWLLFWEKRVERVVCAPAA